MTVTCTLSRSGSYSVTFDVKAESGDLMIARDITKPRQKIYNSLSGLPRSRDNWSALDSFTVVGVLDGTDAYMQARKLALLFKEKSNGSDLILDLTDLNPPYASTYKVAPQSQEALTLTYLPGRKNVVEVLVQVFVVDSTQG